MSKPIITTYNSIADVAAAWAEIDRRSAGIGPAEGYTFYQTLTWNRFVDRSLRTTMPFRLGLKHIDYIVASVDDTVVAILPLVVSKSGHKIEFVSWKLSGCNNMSAIALADPEAATVADAVVSHVLTRYAGYKLKLYDVPCDSPLEQALERLCPGLKVSPRPSFHIPLATWPDYDAYFKSLSSHQRQNLRTLYNHVARDGQRVELHVYDRNSLPGNTLMRRVWHLYFLRKAIWRNKRSTVFDAVVRGIEVAREMSGMKTRSLRELDNTRLFTLEVDGTLMAFMLMYIGEGGNAVVPKLAIHPDYQRYSPGNLLLVETLRWCYANGVTDFDLSRGDEVYKRRFGGVEVPIARLSAKI